jgi:diacylglycerol kinase family enzyme
MLGIPADVIDATEHLLALASNWQTRNVDLGVVDARFFLFSAGVGLDAAVVERVDSRPRLKARLGQYYYAWVAASTFGRRYLFKPPRLAAELGSRNGDGDAPPLQGVTVVIQNGSPYTYFGRRAVEMAEGASLDSGDLAGLILKRTSPLDIPSIAWRALSPRMRVAGHRQIEPFAAQERLRIRSLDERPLPVQVDGDFIGSATEHSFSIAPGALTILA